MTRTMFAHSRQEPLSILVVLAVGQNNFGNKIPFFAIQSQQSIIVLGKRVACTQSGPRKIQQSISQQSVISNFALVIIQIVGPVHEKGQFMSIASVCIELNMFHYTNVQKKCLAKIEHTPTILCFSNRHNTKSSTCAKIGLSNDHLNLSEIDFHIKCKQGRLCQNVHKIYYLFGFLYVPISLLF